MPPPNSANIAIYHEYSATFDTTRSLSKLNGILKVPVVLAAEMVQDYHISEIPWFQKMIGKDVQYIKVFKDYNELKKGVDDLHIRGIDELPFVMPHSQATFLKDHVPSKYSKYITEYISPSEIKGKIRDLTANDILRRIEGWLYLKIVDHDPKFIADCENGIVTNVSIGFICDWDNGGSFEGTTYSLRQTDIQYGHLAGLMDAQGKCPKGICGINQDHKITVIADGLYKHMIQDHPRHLVQSINLTTDQIPPSGICPCNTTVENHLHSNTTDRVPSRELISTSLPIHKQGVLAMTEAELQAEIAALRSLVSQNKDAVSDLAKVKSELADIKKINTDQAAEVEKCKTENKKMGDILKADIIPKITDFYKTDTYGDKKIADLCLHDLQVVYVGVQKAMDLMLKQGGSPGKGTQESHDAKKFGAASAVPSVPDAIADNESPKK